MKLWSAMVACVFVCLGAAWSPAENPGELQISSLERLRESFADPPAAYRPAPLWVWNDDMQEEEIARQLDELKAGGFGGVFVHPRPGLVTPYLSDRWLKLWRFTADEAAKRGMVTYIYDENSYPSGFAGGLVPDQLPNVRQESLKRMEFTPEQLGQMEFTADTIALYRVKNTQSGEFERISLPDIYSDTTKSAADLGLKPDTYIVYQREYSQPSPWYGGKTFVDLMRPEVTQAFLDITFSAYDKVLTDLYGKTVLASFTDEPQVAGAWSPMIPKAFRDRWGYDILDCLPSIHADVGDWRKVRHDYSATILDLFMTNFAQPYFEACEKRGIAFTGHVWEHGWPHLNHNPDIMSFYAWERWPGIDCLMNNYGEGTDAQFGNYRSNKELDSVANQYGRVRKLCETYGAGGWDLEMADVKRIGDHLYVGGVNLMNPHLSYYTLRGARKRDHPQSFSYHEPYWEAFHIPMDYFGRLSWALAAGKEKNPILIIQPTVTMWMYNWSASQGEMLQKLGSEFQSFITELGAAQVAFDLGSEPIMASRAKVRGNQLQIGECEYRAVLLPPGLECLESSTVKLLDQFVENGGTIVSWVGAPAYVDGHASDAGESLKKKAGERWLEEKLTPKQIAEKWGNGGIWISATPAKDGRVYHYVREFEEGRLLFLANSSITAGASGVVEALGSFVEEWNAVEGNFTTAPFAAADVPNKGMVSKWAFELPPAGSALFAIYRDDPKRQLEEPQKWEAAPAPLKPTGEMKVEALQPNVITLDYVDMKARDDSAEGVYFYNAQTRIYKAHGFAKNPWDNAVQFKDELIQKDHFADDSGFELRYPFTLDGFQALPELKAVVERGDRYVVSVNGQEVKPEKDQWQLDRAFNVYVVKAEWLKEGRNEIVTVAKHFSIHMEPEAIYLLGDFNLKSAKKGFDLVPPEPLKLGAWSEQGRPFYADKAAYSQTFTFDASDKKQHYVELTDWKGTAARVDVNGKPAGYVLWQPWRLDITKAIQPGENTVTVVVFGSLKNLLGPHHAGKLRGSAWPSAFWQNPKEGQPSGDEYDFIGYGLFKPFDVY